MSQFKKEKARWPYFAIAATICPPAAVPTAILATKLFEPAEDLLGYGAMGIAILSIVIILVAGLTFSIASLFRKEEPKLLALIALLVNSVALAWVIIKSPG